jgi:hypothetical protein
LSIANKYPVPSGTGNTDQFNGVIAKVSYCQAPAQIEVTSCLNTELPTK